MFFRLCFLFFVVFTSTVFANNEDLYIKKAKSLELQKSQEWLSLLHYKESFFSKSIIVNSDFFLAPDGKTNAASELAATIRSFYDIKNLGDSHALCRFPARFNFLNRYLHFKNLPRPNCKDFNEFYNEINPQSLSIIFPTTYMNNPASMFGHTLIKINGLDKTSMNSIIINYGADTKGQRSGIIFAFKGVFGLYDGIFSATPYYRMINLYNNIENRDIWEYDLNFSKEQAQYYTKHIWELIYSRTKYYFFKENCSYFILESLRPLMPDDDVLDNFIFYTAPIETIKLLKNRNYITDINFRPSLQKQVQESNLTKDEKKDVKKILKNKECNNCSYESYETAYKLLQYKKAKGKLTLNDYRKTSINILRNINNKTQQKNKKIVLNEISPDHGHNFTKVKILYNKDFLEFDLKLAYHELIDSSIGFNFGSEINFFDLGLRYNYDDNKIDLNKFNFLNIKSLALWDEFFKPTSFSVLFGINNLYDDYKVLLLETNGGVTLGNEIFAGFLLLGPKVNYSGHFKHNGNIGVNGIAGFLINFKHFKTIVNYRINKFLQNEYNYDEFLIDGNFILNNALSLNFRYEKFFYRKYKNSNGLYFGVSLLF